MFNGNVMSYSPVYITPPITLKLGHCVKWELETEVNNLQYFFYLFVFVNMQ